MFDFPKADPVERGCGDREPGGVYAECGLSPHGSPLEEFLLDPPLPIPDGLDLINKPQLWQRTFPSGEPVYDVEEHPIYDILMWVGAEFYPYCPDFIEEVRRYGASRRLNPNLDLSLLSQASRMILVHPRARNLAWQTQIPPAACHKDMPGHAVALTSIAEQISADEREDDETISPQVPLLVEQEYVHGPQVGPCLYKLWELMPQEAAQTFIAERTPDGDEGEDGAEHQRHPARPLCLRAIGSTVYQYRPTGESADELVPGIFAALPITGVALIRFVDGSVNERARANVAAGFSAYGEQALPWYESDR
jgi:hypothetical protein